MAENCVVILAGGKGTRMKTEHPKVLCQVLFKPMLSWVLDACATAGLPAERTCVVTGYQKEAVEALVVSKDPRYQTVFQEQRLGTGHAVMMAESFLAQNAGGNVLILYGDAPFIDPQTIRSSLAVHQQNQNAVTVVTAELKDPAYYGRIVREGDRLQEIVEYKDATEAQRQIHEVNSGIYWFRISALQKALAGLNNQNTQNEYYLTDTIRILRESGEKTEAYRTENSRVILGANSRTDLLALNETAKQQIISQHLENGVEFVSLDGVLIGPDVVIGPDTCILPGTILRGKTVIGAGCTIGPDSLLEDTIVGDSTILNSVQAYQSVIHDHVKIGPFCHIRPNSEIKSGVKIGDFVEVKNSVIDESTAVAHLTYVGDSDVGKRVNFGCGVVTVNYDGLHKHRTQIGDDCFIGCNTNLVAPVTLGNGVYTAAGSTITDDVPDGALAIARSRQEIKEGYAYQKLGDKIR